MNDIQRKVALEFGYSDSIISLSFSRFQFKNAGDLIEYLDIHEKELEKEVIKINETNLRNETERLYQETLCVKCEKDERQTVILPCSHFCLCVASEKRCRFCPIKDWAMLITFTVRTYVV